MAVNCCIHRLIHPFSLGIADDVCDTRVVLPCPTSCCGVLWGLQLKPDLSEHLPVTIELSQELALLGPPKHVGLLSDDCSSGLYL